MWARYTYAPYLTPNPLLEGVPMPSAALCEYAYEAAGIDLTPGATGNHSCPEVIYATVKHWSDGLKDLAGVSARLFAIIRDPTGAPQPTLDELGKEVPLPTLEPASARRAPRKPTRKETKKRR